MSQQIRIVKVDNVAIDENTLVKVKRMGNQTKWCIYNKCECDRL